MVQEETFFSREKLEEQVNSLNCVKKENQIAPENAYVSFVNSEFTIVPETEGNELNTKEAYQMICRAIDNDAAEVNLESDPKAYKKADVTKESSELQNMVNTYKNLTKANITYTFGDETVRILVIEDEMSINDLLCMNLEIAGYETVGYLDGNEAYEAIIQDHAFQCALVDIMLPGRDGYSLLPKLKQYEIPVIFLTAKGDIASKIKGLKDGAEDYIVKPFEMLEVMVRLEKVLERNGTVQEQIQIGDVIIDTASRTVTKMGMEIYLKPMEYNCLMVFAKNPNKALTRNQILQELWNEEFCGETRTVDAHVGRIRKKLGWQDKIKTIPRIGYRLKVDL